MRNDRAPFEKRKKPATAEIPILLATVLGREQLHEGLVRITLGGGDIPGFVPAGPDQFIYVFVPKPGQASPNVDHAFTWDAWREMPEEERPTGRYYTVRRHDPAAGTLDIDCVLHGDGPGGTWAASCEPGSAVAIWGPRFAWDPPAEVEWAVLFGDETGLPAIGAILESSPLPGRVIAFIEVAGAEWRQDLRAGDCIEVRWLYRTDEAGKSTLLERAVRAADLPAGVGYAWGGCEARTAIALRKYFREERDFNAACVDSIAYWRHRETTAADE
jgi:NADPH-dependent ferric siderophore reductase